MGKGSEKLTTAKILELIELHHKAIAALRRRIDPDDLVTNELKESYRDEMSICRVEALLHEYDIDGDKWLDFFRRLKLGQANGIEIGKGKFVVLKESNHGD